MLIFKKGTKLYSILMNKCPRCHIGKFWPNNNPYKSLFLKSSNEYLFCQNCNLKFEIEVGFWYGAMYISYALGVAMMVGLWLICDYIYPSSTILFQIALISLFLLVVSPINYHYSRLIWINIFVKYKKK